MSPLPTYQTPALVLCHQFWREDPFDNTYAYVDDLLVFIPNVDSDGSLDWAELLVPFVEYWNQREHLRVELLSRI